MSINTLAAFNIKFVKFQKIYANILRCSTSYTIAAQAAVDRMKHTGVANSPPPFNGI
jgi:hypothetical protein